NLAPELHYVAAWQNHRQCQHVIQGDAVFQTVRAPGVLGDVATDGARCLARWIGRVEQSVRGHVPVQSEIDHSRLDGCAPIFDVQGNDFLETVQSEDNGVVAEGAAG